MGQIKTKKEIRTIDTKQEESVSYCQSCLEYGMYRVLQERVYPPGQPKPRDHELWKQCHNCGQIVPFSEVKQESKLQDFVEISDYPFDQSATILGSGNKKTKRQISKRKKETLDRIEKEKDPELEQN